MTIAISCRLKPSISRPPHRILQQSFQQNFQQSIRAGRAASYATNSASIQPGEYFRVWCRDHGIFLPYEMKGLGFKLPSNPFKLNVLVSRRHCVDVTSMKYFDKFEHPFGRTMFDFYIAKKNRPLWYSAWGGIGARPFVCSTAKRKIEHAVRDALASHGYDREGRRMASAEDSVVQDLFGTLKINTMEPKLVCNAEFADLLKQMELIVRAVEIELRRGRDGRHLTPASRPKPRQDSQAAARPTTSARGHGPELGRITNNAITKRPW